MQRNKIIFITLIAIVCLIGIGVGAYFIFKPSHDPEDPPAETESTYYSDLFQALQVVKNEDYENNSLMVQKEQAGVSIEFIDGVLSIELLKDLEISDQLLLEKNLILDLNGKNLTSSSELAIKVTSGNIIINGEKEGSKISLVNANGKATLLQVNAGKCIINGGSYETQTSGAGTTESPNYCILNDGGTLEINNASMAFKDNDDGVLYGVAVTEENSAKIKNTTILVTSPNGLNSFGVKNDGNLQMENCIVNAHSNYAANEQHNDYAATSRGIYNNGTAVLKNCTVKGIHSGITTKGALFIDGGTYSGYGHGGIYFSNSNSTSYVKNATITICDMPDGYLDDGIAGTNGSGFYIGGASDVTVYMDNCEISGTIYPFVLRSSGGEANNEIYISNSSINKDCSRYIRIDANTSKNQKLYIGSGNNFTTKEDCYKEENVEETDIDYSEFFPAY